MNKLICLIILTVLVVGCSQTPKLETEEPVKKIDVRGYLVELWLIQDREEITEPQKEALENLFKKIKGKQINNTGVLIVPQSEEDKIQSLIKHEHISIIFQPRLITRDDQTVKFILGVGAFTDSWDNTVQIRLKVTEVDRPEKVMLNIEINTKGKSLYHCDPYKGEVECTLEDFVIIPWKSEDKKVGRVIFRITEVTNLGDLIAPK